MEEYYQYSPNLQIRAIAVAAVLAAVASSAHLARPAHAQNCGCPPSHCCNQYGYCRPCRRGSCSKSAGAGVNIDVAEVVSDAFFDGITGHAGGGCPGKPFYTRSAFLEAVGSCQAFARAATADDSKREIAAFFAHVTNHTGRFCYIEEVDGLSKDYCDESDTEYPCVPGKAYYGRGPMQLSWNYNYGAAGESIGFNGLGSPETVTHNPVISFKTALWLWMTKVHPVIGQGFGATIRALDGGGGDRCGGGRVNSTPIKALVEYYKNYCRQLGVQPGNNLYC